MNLASDAGRTAEAPANPLIVLRVERALQAQFAGLLGARSGAGPRALATALAALAPEQLSAVLRWIEAIAASDLELAYAFAERAPEAGTRLPIADLDRWVERAMAAFDERGLGAGLAALETLEEFRAARSAPAHAVALDAVAAILQRLVTGFGGRALRIEAGPAAYTDTETVFLPARIDSESTAAENFALYKAMLAHHWAQTAWGTWRAPLVAALQTHASASAAWAAYAALERARLDARLAHEYPGIGRIMAKFAPAEPDPNWSMPADAAAEDSLARIPALIAHAPPAPRAYHGAFIPAAVAATVETRIERERRRLPVVLSELAYVMERTRAMDHGGATARAGSARFSLAVGAGRGSTRAATFELRFANRPVQIPAEAGALIASILQDLGEVPPESLVAAGAERYDTGASSAETASLHGGLFDTEGCHRYPEWDHVRNRYRPGYCTVRELDGEPGTPEFVRETLRKHAGLVRTIRRGFEAIVSAPRSLRGQVDGEDIDLDAVVEAQVDALRGREPDARLYTRLTRRDRDVAVLILVDMSGSTRGWVNEAERESLVLLAEALERLGDSYAIYGFSGRTHKRCEVYRVKRFDERYDEAVRARISGVAPKSYTRLGAAVRHLGAVLRAHGARTRILITLSDGKPEDYRSYHGVYGIEDTRRALLELRAAGIHPYCITLDREGGDYLPRLYGPARYVVIDAVHKLPLRVADIYRRLTT